MENKHTPEPWGVNPDRPCEVRQCDENGNPRLQLVADTSTVNARVPWRENARRIVACVNACSGVSTEILELISRVGGIAHKMTAIAALSVRLDELEQQRDELLELLPKELPDNFIGFGKNYAEHCTKFAPLYDDMSKFRRKWVEDCLKARAATAKATGGGE